MKTSSMEIGTIIKFMETVFFLIVCMEYGFIFVLMVKEEEVERPMPNSLFFFISQWYHVALSTDPSHVCLKISIKFVVCSTTYLFFCWRKFF